MLGWPCIMNYMYSNQLYALFIFSLLNYHTSIHFGHMSSPSSGGRIYIWLCQQAWQCYNVCGTNRELFEYSEVVHEVRTHQCIPMHQISSFSHWHTCYNILPYLHTLKSYSVETNGKCNIWPLRTIAILLAYLNLLLV
jgi:hypothetical protein